MKDFREPGEASTGTRDAPDGGPPTAQPRHNPDLPPGRPTEEE